MNTKLYRYEVISRSIYIVDRYEVGFNIFDTLKEAKDFACTNMSGVNQAEYANVKERIRLITKQELFDNLFDNYNDLREDFINRISLNKEELCQ